MREVNPDRNIDFSKIKVLLFDWDGVFHSGYKNHLGESLYSEADSMGVNMLRLGYYLLHQSIPYTAIITGESNPTADFLANREHFNGLYSKVKDKKIILDHLEKHLKIRKEEILFVYDDVLDLSLAKEVAIRFLVQRNASKRFKNMVIENECCDYITENPGDQHAVREICEFVLDEMNLLEKTFQTRINYGEIYQKYLSARQKIALEKYTMVDNQLIAV